MIHLSSMSGVEATAPW